MHLGLNAHVLWRPVEREHPGPARIIIILTTIIVIIIIVIIINIKLNTRPLAQLAPTSNSCCSETSAHLGRQDSGKLRE